jgi:hypothetical protein
MHSRSDTFSALRRPSSAAAQSSSAKRAARAYVFPVGAALRPLHQPREGAHLHVRQTVVFAELSGKLAEEGECSRREVR